MVETCEPVEIPSVMYKLLFIYLVLLFQTACSGLKVTHDDGTISYIVVGLGVISVPKQDPNTAINAFRSHTLGLGILTGTSPELTAGYAFRARVVVPDGTRNTCAEISQKLFGTINVSTCKDLNTITTDKSGDINESE